MTIYRYGLWLWGNFITLRASIRDDDDDGRNQGFGVHSFLEFTAQILVQHSPPLHQNFLNQLELKY